MRESRCWSCPCILIVFENPSPSGSTNPYFMQVPRWVGKVLGNQILGIILLIRGGLTDEVWGLTRVYSIILVIDKSPTRQQGEDFTITLDYNYLTIYIVSIEIDTTYINFTISTDI